MPLVTISLRYFTVIPHVRGYSCGLNVQSNHHATRSPARGHQQLQSRAVRTLCCCTKGAEA